jgi:ABC-2 type transport system permease protein
MIIKIAKKEFTALLRDGRFRLTGLVIFALLIVSFLVGWDYFQKTSSERAAVQETNYEQWLNQGKRNAHSATHYGLYAFKPLLPLAFADKGLDGYTGTAIFLESHKQNEAKLRPAKDAAAAHSRITPTAERLTSTPSKIRMSKVRSCCRRTEIISRTRPEL